MTATVHKLKSAGRAVVYDGPLPRESASEIAARLRAGKPPLRGLVWQESIDGDAACAARATDAPHEARILGLRHSVGIAIARSAR